MPLLHQTVTRPFRLNRQAIKHARLTNREIADVDHLLHFAFAFGDNFPSLEGNELPELIGGSCAPQKELRGHYHFCVRQYLRKISIASSTTSFVMSSAGRKRMECSPDFKTSRPESNSFRQTSSRVLASGRSKAMNKPRPRTADTISHSRCQSRSCSRK